jgi:hypothetical protein
MDIDRCRFCHVDLVYDRIESNLVCPQCGDCQFVLEDIAGNKSGFESYSDPPRTIRNTRYRPSYYLREKIRNACGACPSFDPRVLAVVDAEWRRVQALHPELRLQEAVVNPYRARSVIRQILGHLAADSSLDKELHRRFQSPKLKERWSVIWTHWTGKQMPLQQVDPAFMDEIETMYHGVLGGFQQSKEAVWSAKRKNVPFLNEIIGVQVLRKWGVAAYLSLAPWFSPPKTKTTRRKVARFIRESTARGWIPAAPSPSQVESPPEVYEQMKAADSLRIYSALLK